jgi:hypothetical protein
VRVKLEVNPPHSNSLPLGERELILESEIKMQRYKSKVKNRIFFDKLRMSGAQRSRILT